MSVSQKKVPTFEKFITPRLLHGFESSNSIKAERSKNFCDFSHAPTITTNKDKSNFTKISWLQNDSKMAQNIDQFMNDFSHRTMEEMQILMSERYPLYINCHGIENLSFFVKIDVL